MKHFRFTLLAVAIFASHMILANNAHKHELRATWLATVQNIDWPTTLVTNDATRKQQQKELTDIFDKLVAGNMHACFMQVRSLCDAMYQSSYEPWSIALTGTRGKDPGYDPLAFAIEEAHKRGLELHIWVNPFRVTSSGSLSSSDQLQQHAGEWIIKYDNGSFKGQIIDPGYPQARAYVIKVLMEIVNNYDVDGIVMDDYFYPYGGTTTEDAKSKSLYKPNNVVDVNQDGDTDDDWRRNNVDVCLQQLYDTIQAVKPWVRFGMGTFGIWSTQQKAAEAYGITLPSGIRGLDDYDVQACNPIEWVKNGYVDYINPQLYWSTNVAAQDYKVLCKWWAKDVCEHFSNQLPDGKKVHFFISQAAYHAYDGYAGYDAGVGEIQKQIDVNRANLSSGYTGSVFYNTTAYNKMYLELRDSHFMHKALPPAMDWKVKEPLTAPENLRVENNTLLWEHAVAERFTIYAYPIGLNWATAQQTGTYLQDIVYGKEYALSHIPNWQALTIAVCSYDRYGVEHQAAIINEGKFPESDPNATEITWVLNGGVVPGGEVPSNEQLIASFKDGYNTYFSQSIATTRELSNFLYYGNSQGCDVSKMLTDEKSGWKWLGDYLLSVAGSLDGESAWRWHLFAFFNCNDGTVTDTQKVAAADFSQAGKPEAWGDAYRMAYGLTGDLPTKVTETFVLPIPVKDGYVFVGWFDNPEGTGTAITSIPAGWYGTLYAIWKINGTTDIDYLPTQTNNVQKIMQDGQIFILRDGKIYNIMGQMQD